MSMLRNHRLSVVILSLLASVAVAGAIKVWSSGETLTSAQLNANFSHIHSLMVGGHGARLVNADVAANAAIALSKIAITPALLPKAYANVEPASGTTCNTGSYPLACAFSGSGVSGVSNTALGTYAVTLSANPTNTDFAVIASAHLTGFRAMTSTGFSVTGPHFVVYSNTLPNPDGGTAAAPVGTSFSFVYLDN